MELDILGIGHPWNWTSLERDILGIGYPWSWISLELGILWYLLVSLDILWLLVINRFHFHSCFRLLRALALSDLCVMVTGALLYGMPGISGTYANQVVPMIAPYLLPLAQTSIMTSVYLAVLMAFERYIRICFTCQLRMTRIITDHKLK